MAWKDRKQQYFSLIDIIQKHIDTEQTEDVRSIP